MYDRFFERLPAYGRLIRFERPVGTWLLLWPALWGLLLARDGWPDVSNIIIFVLGTFLMRSAGCAINDFADRHIDGLVARTRQRPLASGIISGGEALLLALVFAVLAFVCVLQTNWLTIKLSFFALIFAGVYPFAKRWIVSPQLVLGGAFAWAIPMGFAAELNHVPAVAWGYWLITIIWVFAYDTYYAMADQADDKHLNIGSTALLFHPYAAEVSITLQLVFIGLFVWLTRLSWLIMLAVGICTFFQYHLLSQNTAPSDSAGISFYPEHCIKAFKLSNLIGLLLTLGLILSKM